MTEHGYSQRARRWMAGGSHPRAFLLWLVILVLASTETVIAVVERWPAQFGGAGDPAQIGTQWMSKGTALSPPLFILVALALAPLLLMVARRPAAIRAAAAVAVAAGAIGIVGSLGELLAPASADVPRAVQDVALLGVAACVLLVVTGLALIARPEVPAP